jgi:hypothetical protein
VDARRLAVRLRRRWPWGRRRHRVKLLIASILAYSLSIAASHLSSAASCLSHSACHLSMASNSASVGLGASRSSRRICARTSLRRLSDSRQNRANSAAIRASASSTDIYAKEV